MPEYVIGLGSNIEPAKHIPAALQALGRFELLGTSKTYETAAIDRPDQDDYWNCAVHIRTGLARPALHDELRGIEASLGRVREKDKYAARTIDLDILWDGQADPEVARRPFWRWCFDDLKVAYGAPRSRRPRD